MKWLLISIFLISCSSIKEQNLSNTLKKDKAKRVKVEKPKGNNKSCPFNKCK